MNDTQRQRYAELRSKFGRKDRSGTGFMVNPASDDGLRWIEGIGKAWRLAGYADELSRNIQHTGWYTEGDGINGEKFRGVVYRLPSRKVRKLIIRGRRFEIPTGKTQPVYFVGYADLYNDDAARGEIVTDCEDDEDAARAADEVARIAADREREYNSAWRVGSNYAATFERVEQERETRRKLLAELRHIRSTYHYTETVETPTLCNLIKDRLRQTRANIRAALQERADLTDNYYLRNGGSLVEAFADGAGITVEEARAL